MPAPMALASRSCVSATTALSPRASGWAAWRRPTMSSCLVIRAARSAAAGSVRCRPDRGRVGRLLGHERGVGHDDGQQVVEVVGDPAGQLAQALEPLGLMQLMLQRAAIGLNAVAFSHVPGHGPRPGHCAACVPDRGDGDRHVEDGSVFTGTFGLEMLDPFPPSHAVEDGCQLVGPVRRSRARTRCAR